MTLTSLMFLLDRNILNLSAYIVISLLLNDEDSYHSGQLHATTLYDAVTAISSELKVTYSVSTLHPVFQTSVCCKEQHPGSLFMSHKCTLPEVVCVTYSNCL